ncbi:hypothetical protein BKP35_13165 [Anaerobacillus arseniciselenatis]|uniref:DUF707 domain-containing protein n=1 Tax=Anaerobacillus arseniciselenatis TaxID=85682 RepID=A0A1S2LFD6_9BACI|nr:hypothetical protein [Anaerobacillus arseniciselenatis]OIJ10773.1 hypothetical protein BKP35_13165 [Anaerobacillus arseniciselenatis]
MSLLRRKKKMRFLIIARVGDDSLHHEWLSSIEHKNFDLCISYFGDTPGRFKEDSDFYFESKGPKWPIIKEVLSKLGEKINQYEAVWIPDDDISTNTPNINRMFERFIEQGFELAQPALTTESHHSHFITIEQPDYLWRYCNFVEIMVPIFSKSALGICWDTFDYCQSGWGLDLLWPKLLGFPHKKMAIIDETPVFHTRPIGAGTLYNGISPHHELNQMIIKYNLDSSLIHSRHYDGVLRKRRMFVLILAHMDEHVLDVQIQNVRHFNPDAGIILYRSGTNEDFAKNLRVPICPYSRTVHYANSARVLWDVMRWFEETNVDYEYLISFDHDMLFVKPGFENFLDNCMKEYDCMGWQKLTGTEIEKYPDPRVGQSLWEEWHKWRPIFKVDNFLRYFNPGQVYRKGIISKMVSYLKTTIDQKELDRLFNETQILGFEEMFSVTLALANGGRCGEYPDGQFYNNAVRWGENITLDEAISVIKHPSYFWIHPIKGNSLVEMHQWLLSNSEGEKNSMTILT